MKTIKIAPHVPTTVDVEEINENRIKITAYPFESGYAVTLAHPIRRLLLSSSVGLAPIGLKIKGISHEFDSIRGIAEDVSPFIINLRNIRFLSKQDVDDRIVASYSFRGPLNLTGAHLANSEVAVVNKEAVLASINEDAVFEFSIIIQKGIGYVPSEDIRSLIPNDYIPLDAYFTPVRKAVYEIENLLVDDDPSYEKIIFYVETDGQVNPYDAFKQAVSTMYSQMSIFDVDMRSVPKTSNNSFDENFDFKVLLTKIDTLSLSARCFNCLDRVGVRFIGELVMMGETELKKVKNMGKKSYEEIADKLRDLGYPLDVSLSEEKKSTLNVRISKLKS